QGGRPKLYEGSGGCCQQGGRHSGAKLHGSFQAIRTPYGGRDGTATDRTGVNSGRDGERTLQSVIFLWGQERSDNQSRIAAAGLGVGRVRARAAGFASWTIRWSVGAAARTPTTSNASSASGAHPRHRWKRSREMWQGSQGRQRR
ncbi:unnamed protein product, partial [Ectocarpus sp. 12 AP-2014]